MLRRGEPAPGNGPLVQRLADVTRALERPIADVAQAQQLLRLAPV